MSSNKGKSGLLDPLDSLDRGVEVVRTVTSQTAHEFKEETKRARDEAFRQILGLESHSSDKADHGHEAAPAKSHSGEIFNAKHHASSEKPKSHHAEKAKPQAEAAIHYGSEIAKSGERASHRELSEMQQNIENIKHELSKLVASSQVLKLNFATVGVEQSTKKPGKYHLNLLEWMLGVIRAAREQVESSNAWLGTIKGKGAKQDYWSMFQKHGTSFSQNGEVSGNQAVG